MNDERAAIINAVVEQRRSPADAVPLLDALLQRETGESSVVEPPCRLPPWREADGDYALLAGRDAVAILETATHQISKGLEDGHMDRLTVNFSILEAMYLADFWTEGHDARYTIGSMVLKEAADRLDREWVDIAVAADSIALALFWNPRQLVRPFPTDAMEPRRLEAADGEEIEVVVSAGHERDPVKTPLGTFGGCLKVERRITYPGPPGEPAVAEGLRAETLVVWMAPGIGPVRIVRENAEGSRTVFELTSHSTEGDDGFFPRRPGFWWRFDSRDDERVRREIWRTLAHPEPGSTWLIASAYTAKLD